MNPAYFIRKLKAVVLREEYFALTQDHRQAIILGQMIYWSQRAKDFDDLIQEECMRSPDCNMPLQHGWFYKKAEELGQETMLDLSPRMIRRYMNVLVDKGWFEKRSNPEHKWDRISQYRVNLRCLQEDLNAIGYTLPGMTNLPPMEVPVREENTPECPKNGSNVERTPMTVRTDTHDRSNGHPVPFERTPMTVHIPIQRLHTEITNIDNVSDVTDVSNVSLLEERDEVDISQCKQMVADWSDATGQVVFYTEERGRKLVEVMKSHFKNDMREWKRFCEYVSQNDFLMGISKPSFKAQLDWSIREPNFSKIISGGFHGHPFTQEEARHERRTSRDAEVKEVLNSIEDYQWREWCTHLAMVDNGITPMKLLDISKAKFSEYDDRVVYIECQDSKTLNYIENIRVTSKLIDVLRGTYPDMRFFSTVLA